MTIRALSFAAIALAGAEASSIYRGCLSETESTGKYSWDVASYQPYRRSNLMDMEVPSNYRITEAYICTGAGAGQLKGFQFTLSDPSNPGSAPISLPYMGKEVAAERCETVAVPGPIQTITTTTNHDEFVNSLTITTAGSDWIAAYPCSENCKNEKTWTFAADEPMVAMYGKLNDENKIKQLGWLTLDVDCQAAQEQDPTPPVLPPTPQPAPQPQPRPTPTNTDNSWTAFLYQLFEDSLWDRLSQDVNAQMQQPQGYVGYPGGGLAVEIFAHNQQDLRLNAKLNTKNGKSSTGYYLGCGAALTVIALGAYSYSKKGQKKVVTNVESGEFSFQI